ncbi:hypothetical protein P43SY_008699 [Pythium insidiosum]|uniref:Uncharacterized protein n=1 Tax=Pythium insidiosum TaxID=114742 RepID=A0AAD5M4G1_PYTIN|nr:hypothetical protein P43SY_008699 [Pythium insidiosum]
MLMRGSSVGAAEFLETSRGDETSSACASVETSEVEKREQAPTRSHSLARRRSDKQGWINRVDSKLVDRLQRWYDAAGHDPTAETSSDHTASSPSRISQSFVDGDGNLRRKSALNLDLETNDERPASPASKISIRRSTVLEMVQLIVED